MALALWLSSRTVRRAALTEPRLAPPPSDDFVIAYERALVFLKSSTTYRANRLLRFVPDDGASRA